MKLDLPRLVRLVITVFAGIVMGALTAHIARKIASSHAAEAEQSALRPPARVVQSRADERTTEAASLHHWLSLLERLGARPERGEFVRWAAALQELPPDQFPRLLKLVREAGTPDDLAERILFEVWACRSPRTLIAWWRSQVGPSEPPSEKLRWLPLATMADPASAIAWASETLWKKGSENAKDSILRPALTVDPLATLRTLLADNPSAGLSSTDATMVLRGATTWDQCAGCLRIVASRPNSWRGTYYDELIGTLIERALTMNREGTQALIRSETDPQTKSRMVEEWFAVEITTASDPPRVASSWWAESASLTAETRLRVLARTWPLAHAASAGTWLAAQSDSPEVRRCRESLAQRFVAHEPAAAVSLVESVPDDRWQARALADLYARWARSDVRSATTFFQDREWDQTAAQWLRERMALYSASMAPVMPR